MQDGTSALNKMGWNFENAYLLRLRHQFWYFKRPLECGIEISDLASFWLNDLVITNRHFFS